MKDKICLLTAVLFCFVLTSLNLYGQNKIINSAIANGATLQNGVSKRIIGTIGQPLIGRMESQSNLVEAGFWEQSTVLITDAEESGDKTLPKEFNLYQNYPNPFNPTTTITFDLPKQSHVILKVYNILGQEVSTLINETKKSGSYKINFNASALSSGVYLYRIQTDDFTRSKKMILLK